MKTVVYHKGSFYVGTLTGTAIATLLFACMTFWFIGKNEQSYIKLLNGMVKMAEESSNSYDDVVMLREACGEKCATLELKTKGDF